LGYALWKISSNCGEPQAAAMDSSSGAVSGRCSRTALARVRADQRKMPEFPVVVAGGDKLLGAVLIGLFR